MWGGEEGFDLKKGGTIYPYTVFRAMRITFSLANRVENQNEPKRPQGGGRLGSFWFSTRPSADTGTDYNLHHALKSVMHRVLRALHWQGVDYNPCLCLPKAELKTKTNPNGHHFVAVCTTLWPFGFVLVFNSIN